MSMLSVKDEVKLLRSALIGLVGKDREGNYRADFVREMYTDLKRKPTQTFSNKEDFLALLK
ncbi:hypothetical protein KC845_03800 [Candidatus Kaiserbacteria bacterium]|nr:hypothetical protein [Candidatus Kaiserbacteria bacterium]